jgi:hypothetical protein
MAKRTNNKRSRKLQPKQRSVFPKQMTSVQKYKHFPIDEFVTTTPTNHYLTDIDGGSLYNNRVGNRIFVTHVTFNLTYTCAVQDGTNIMRSTIVQYPGEDMAQYPASVTAPLNLYAAKYLFDNVLNTNYIENPTDGPYFNKKYLARTVSVRKPVNYLDNDGNNVCLNALAMAFVSDSGAEDHPTVKGEVYVFFNN